MVDSHKGSPMNFTEAVLLSIYNIISRAAFGMECKDQEEFISVVKEAVTIGSGFNIGDLFPSAKWLQLVTGLRPKLERLHRQIDRILEGIINEHKQANSKGYSEAKEDLVDVLLKFQDGNDSNQDICLSINNIKAIILVKFTSLLSLELRRMFNTCTRIFTHEPFKIVNYAPISMMYYWMPSAYTFLNSMPSKLFLLT